MTDNELSKPLRILLVDDEELVRDFLTDMLTAKGFLVQAAPTGEVALQLARDEPPDLVLSDVNMPGMDGIELLSLFGEDADLDGVPFFLMSGNPDEEARGLQAGAVRFFHKPIADGALLVRAIEATRPLTALEDGLYRAVLEATPAGVVVTDPDGRVSWANEAFLTLSGYALSELQGRKPGDLLQGPGTDAVTVTRIRQALAERRTCTEGLLSYDKRGQPYWATLEINPLNVGGTHLGFFAFVRSSMPQARGTALGLTVPQVPAARDGLSSLHKHLAAAMTCLTEAASEGGAPQELHAALVSVLAASIREARGALGVVVARPRRINT